MASQVLSRKEFDELLEKDRRAAWADAERTAEDYALRVWKLRRLLSTVGRSENGNVQQTQGTDHIEL